MVLSSVHFLVQNCVKPHQMCIFLLLLYLWRGLKNPPKNVKQNVEKNKNDYRWISSGHVTEFGESLVIAYLSV